MGVLPPSSLVTIFLNQDLVNAIERPLKGALRNDNVPGHHIWGEQMATLKATQGRKQSKGQKNPTSVLLTWKLDYTQLTEHYTHILYGYPPLIRLIE